jgi:hypothetical protein
MELFKITCLTCRARLSVRDAALVGQIIGCPRCGMMVQVTAPTAAVAALAPAASQAAASADAVALPSFDQVLHEPAAAAQDAVPSSVEVNVPTFDDAMASFSPAAIPNAIEAAAPSTPLAAAPQRGWATYKLGAVVIGGGVLGSLIVAVSLSFLNQSGAELNAAAPAEVAQASLPQSEAEAEAEDAIPAAPEVAAAGGTEPTAPTETATGADALMPLEANEPPAAAPAPNVAPTSEQLAVSSAVIEPAADAAEVPSAEPAAAPPRLRIDPLDVDPEGLDLSSLYSAPAKDPLAESQLPIEADVPPSVPPAEPPAQQEPQQQARPAVRRNDRGGVGAPSNEAALLARRLSAVEWKKAPLCRVLDLSVQLSGLPVSVAPQELRMAAVAAGAPTLFSAKNSTIEQLLAAAGEPLRLKPVVEGKQILLKHVREDQRRTVDYAVDDLAAGTEQVTRLAAWIPQLAAPDAWPASGGDASITIDGMKLRIDAPVSVQYEVLFVLERLRLTSDLPTRSKYPSSLLGPGAFHSSIENRLSAPAVFTFSEYVPLREVFRYWQEEMDLAVLIDWPALSTERLWPNTRVACSAADKSWSEALDSVLAPLGLAWRAVDHGTIEITTAAKVDAEPMLETYRLAEDAAANGEGPVGRVTALTDDDNAEGIVYDDHSRVLLVRQPAAVHRKIIREFAGSIVSPNEVTR